MAAKWRLEWDVGPLKIGYAIWKVSYVQGAEFSREDFFAIGGKSCDGEAWSAFYITFVHSVSSAMDYVGSTHCL